MRDSSVASRVQHPKCHCATLTLVFQAQVAEPPDTMPDSRIICVLGVLCGFLAQQRDRALLRDLCLVSRVVGSIARPYLYRRLSLDESADCTRLSALVWTNARIPKSPALLNICIGAWRSDQWPSII